MSIQACIYSIYYMYVHRGVCTFQNSQKLPKLGKFSLTSPAAESHAGFETYPQGIPATLLK